MAFVLGNAALQEHGRSHNHVALQRSAEQAQAHAAQAENDLASYMQKHASASSDEQASGFRDQLKQIGHEIRTACQQQAGLQQEHTAHVLSSLQELSVRPAQMYCWHLDICADRMLSASAHCSHLVTPPQRFLMYL